MRIGFASFAVVSALGFSSSLARADIQHTISKGHTIEAIANRYGVSVKSIIEANRIKDANRLKVGDVLTIPKVDPPKKSDDARAKDKGRSKDGKDGKGGKTDRKPVTYTAKPKTPGVIHVKRLASTEERDLRVKDNRGKVAAATLKAMEKLMRSGAGASHPIEPRLVALLGVISNHFGSRKIEVVSGFRPYSEAQYTRHSNHNHGKAIDFRVIGVPNEVVRDFCRTLKNVGCGYYPNSTFVHMDVRKSSAFWIDYSKPGEPPRYNAANVEADEGTSDVHDDIRPRVPTPPPSEPPSAEPLERLPPPDDAPPATNDPGSADETSPAPQDGPG